ncbi:GIDE domain-containing protein [Aquimarina sp. 2201CG14-23]|uniref:GIDE domain-containing protein n=1 Tax=Aquimarina mycalae TaxID=3040073 RepID=UPI002478206C|nr:GIDE domain-containing protein [Aquimarina sp. 2201CG14-23]MDH7447474.1 GIDE domain-containing protein [Aquimarina sp. 2201CG14-23]
MNDGIITVFGIGIILIATGITIGYYFSNKNRILRALKKHPFKRIGLIKDNEYVKIKGKAISNDTSLVSPIGKRKCVYYQVEIQEKRSSGKSSHWHTIVKEHKFQDFIIESQTEKAIVITNVPNKNKRIYLNKDVEHSSGTWNDAPEFLENYLRSHGRESTGFLGFNKSIRYKEGAIEVGENITIMGTAKWKESDHNFDQYSSKSLFISGDGENKLIITDDPKAQESKKTSLH